MDLERLFSIPSSSAIAAHDVFTNRQAEKAAFVATLGQLHWVGDEPMRLVESPAIPRRNLLVYYGMGGIGKTTLSKELQRTFTSGEAGSFERLISARIDFAELSAVDVEIMLLRLRASFGQVIPQFPAFDLAFATYWERMHPGEPLGEFLSRRSSLGRLSADIGLAEQIQSTLDTLVGGFGLVGTAWRLGNLLKDGVIKRLNEKRVLQHCPYFQPLIDETSPEKVRPFLPSLISWDLANHQRSSAAAAVVFLDTWEAVQERRAELGGLEGTVNRLIYLMPNVLFVMSGRNRLDWSSPARVATVKYAGPGRWPALDSETSGAQFLVGGLSPGDADEYLRTRLTEHDDPSRPAIPDEIRQRITAAAEGLPLYLELSAEHYDEMLVEGTPDPQNFGTTLPQLVVRVVRDLNADERRLLRAAALVKAFDRNLLKAAVPNITDAAIQRFLRRSFVRSDRQGWLPYSLHDTLRDSVREYDVVSEDPWSGAEWQQAAAGVAQYLEFSSRGDLDPAERNMSRLTECFIQTCILGTFFDLELSWLVDLGTVLVGLGKWEAFDYLESLPLPSTNFLPLRSAFIGMYRRGVGQLAAAESFMRDATSSESLAPHARERVDLMLAEVMVRGNRDSEAEQKLAPIAQSQGPLSDRAASWLAVLDERRGRFDEAARWVELPHPDESLFRFSRNLKGHILLASGRFDEAEIEFRVARDHAERGGLDAAAALMLIDEAWAAIFFDPSRGRLLARSSMEMSERFGNAVSIGRSRSRLALSMVGSAPAERVLEEARRSFAEIEASGYHSDCADPLLVEWLQHCASGNFLGASSTAEKFSDLVQDHGAHEYMLLVGEWWMRLAFTDVGIAFPGRSVFSWIDREDDSQVRSRWEGVLRGRSGPV